MSEMESRTLNVNLKIVFICFLFIGVIQELKSQVTIGAGIPPDKTATLDIVNADKGLLVPRVSLKGATDIVTIPNPVHSLIVYNLTDGNNGTPSDTKDDVHADNLYVFENGKWNLLYQESDLERTLQNLYLPKIISIVSMKKTGNDTSFAGSDMGGGVRKYLFDNKIRDDDNNFNISTGEFIAPSTGFYKIEINILLRPRVVSTGSLCLGISKPYTGNTPEGVSTEKFYSYTDILNPSIGTNYPMYLGYKSFIYINKGEKITPLVRYITPSQFTLNVESINYDRVSTNTISIVFYPVSS